MKQVMALMLAAGLPTAAGAGEPSMKPGLYDYTVKMEMPGMPFALPAQNVRNCLRQEDVDGGKQYNDQKNQDCEVKNLKQSAGKASFDLACKDGTTGKAEYTFTETSMAGKTVMTRDGQPMTLNMSAKRAGDCK